jgi:hypothetical protein
MAEREDELRDSTVGDRDVDAGVIAKFITALLVGTAVVLGITWGLSKLLKGQLVTHDPALPPVIAENPREAAPGPRLQSDPDEDMASLRAEENAALASYAWLSEDKSAARIPVERAMDLVLEKGLPKGMGGGSATPEERAAEGAGGPPAPSPPPGAKR